MRYHPDEPVRSNYMKTSLERVAVRDVIAPIVVSMTQEVLDGLNVRRHLMTFEAKYLNSAKHACV